MAQITEDGFLLNNDRVFLPSSNINIFPCSRRGQSGTEGSATYYDPEARLNTERTNRLHTSINGFKDSFIVNDSFTAGNTLVFTLAGYRVEAKNFYPVKIAEALKIETGTIYAHLSLHKNISLNLKGYSTEILYCQLNSADSPNSLDVFYEDRDSSKSNNFFMGISFAADEIEATAENTKNLPIFSKTGSDTWKLVETSKLPKIEHGDSENSVKITEAIINTIEVPYSGIPYENFENTILNEYGISVPYIQARALKADGITVGGAITITDENNPKQYSSVSSKAISTAGAITADGAIATKTALNVQSDDPENPAIATIDEAVITEASITTADITNAEIGALTVTATTAKGRIDATKDLGEGNNNIEAKRADISALTADTVESASVTASEITATTALYQHKDDTNTVMNVPIIELKQKGSSWQLQISRIGQKN